MLTDRERNLVEILSMMWGVNGNSIQERIPECPVRMIREKIELVSITLSTVQVCFERFRAQSEVHQCERGHFVCGNCRPRVEVREERDLYKTYLGIFQVCPTCRGRMMARCNGFETFLQSLMM